MVPMIININPITLPMVNVSPIKKTANRKTMAGAKLINGYASVISNFDMAAIQNKDATNADTNPEKTNGSKINRIKAPDLSTMPVSGNAKWILEILHFIINCP